MVWCALHYIDAQFGGGVPLLLFRPFKTLGLMFTLALVTYSPNGTAEVARCGQVFTQEPIIATNSLAQESPVNRQDRLSQLFAWWNFHRAEKFLMKKFKDGGNVWEIVQTLVTEEHEFRSSKLNHEVKGLREGGGVYFDEVITEALYVMKFLINYRLKPSNETAKEHYEDSLANFYQKLRTEPILDLVTVEQAAGLSALSLFHAEIINRPDMVYLRERQIKVAHALWLKWPTIVKYLYMTKPDAPNSLEQNFLQLTTSLANYLLAESVALYQYGRSYLDPAMGTMDSSYFSMADKAKSNFLASINAAR